MTSLGRIAEHRHKHAEVDGDCGQNAVECEQFGSCAVDSKLELY